MHGAGHNKTAGATGRRRGPTPVPAAYLDDAKDELGRDGHVLNESLQSLLRDERVASRALYERGSSSSTSRASSSNFELLMALEQATKQAGGNRMAH